MKLIDYFNNIEIIEYWSLLTKYSKRLKIDINVNTY